MAILLLNSSNAYWMHSVDWVLPLRVRMVTRHRPLKVLDQPEVRCLSMIFNTLVPFDSMMSESPDRTLRWVSWHFIRIGNRSSLWATLNIKQLRSFLSWTSRYSHRPPIFRYQNYQARRIHCRVLLRCSTWRKAGVPIRTILTD